MCILGISSLVFFNVFILWTGMCVGAYIPHHSVDRHEKLLPSFHHVGPGNHIQCARFDGNHLGAPSHPTSSLVFLEHLLCAKH